MNQFSRSAIVALAAILSLAACNQGGHHPDKTPDAQGAQADDQYVPAPEARSTPEAQGPVIAENPKSDDSEFAPADEHPNQQALNEKQDEGDAGAFTAVPVPSAPRAETSDEAKEQPAPAAPASKRTQHAQSNDNRPRSYSDESQPGRFAAIGASLAATGSTIYHAVRPDPNAKIRRHVVENLVDQAEEARTIEPVDVKSLKSKISETEPNPDRVRSIITENDETKRLLVRVLTESNPEMVNGASERLWDEVFNTPDTDAAGAKVDQVLVSIRDLASNDAYGEAESARVSMLQSVLDDRMKKDDRAQFLRDMTPWILGFAVPAGFVAGFEGRPIKALGEIKWRKAAQPLEEGVEAAPGFFRRAGSSIREAAASTKARGHKMYTGFKTTVNEKVVRFTAKGEKVTPKPVFEQQFKTLLADAVEKHHDLRGRDVDQMMSQLGFVKMKKGPFSKLNRGPGSTFAGTANVELHVDALASVEGYKTAADDARIVVRKVVTDDKGVVKSEEGFISSPIPSTLSADIKKAITAERVEGELRVVKLVDGQPVAPAPEETNEFLAAGAKKLEESTADVPPTPGSVLDAEARAGAEPMTEEGTLNVSGRSESLPGTDDTKQEIAEEIVRDQVQAKGAFKAGVEKGKAKIDEGVKKGKAAIDDGVQKGKQAYADGKAKASELGAKAQENFREGVKASRGYYETSKAYVKAESKRFRPVPAALWSTGVGASVYFVGDHFYEEGKRYGAGRQLVYLEKLIPQKALTPVVLESEVDAR